MPQLPDFWVGLAAGVPEASPLPFTAARPQGPHPLDAMDAAEEQARYEMLQQWYSSGPAAVFGPGGRIIDPSPLGAAPPTPGAVPPPPADPRLYVAPGGHLIDRGPLGAAPPTPGAVARPPADPRLYIAPGGHLLDLPLSR